MAGMKKIISLLAALFIALLFSLSVCADTGVSYTYDYWKNVKESPAAFGLEQVVDASNLNGAPFGSVDDVCASADGRLFVADKTAGRIYVFDDSGNLLQSIKAIKSSDGKIVINKDGSQLILNGCEGLFMDEETDELYIANTGSMQVVVLDGNDYTFKRVFGKPENMTGTTEFKPSKVAVDHSGRIYLVVQSSYEGIIELNKDGSFSRYFGVNTPKVNLVDYFWKSIASDKQKQKMSKIYAPAFNNVAIDGEGFVMAVTYDSAAEDSVFRLNSGGKNVLREEGNIPVVGDIRSYDSTQSQFVDIAVTDYGTYAVIDKSKGRIFLYNFDGELLNVFGGMGDLKGEFKNPTSIAWLGDKLAVSDGTLNAVYIFAPTDFGKAILKGNEAYYYGRWDEALGYFKEAIRLNANYEPAYSTIGKNYLMKNEYRQAMYYFKLGNNRIFYSKAFNGYRNIVLKKYFYIPAGIILLLIIGIIYSEVRFFQEKRRYYK